MAGLSENLFFKIEGKGENMRSKIQPIPIIAIFFKRGKEKEIKSQRQKIKI